MPRAKVVVLPAKRAEKTHVRAKMWARGRKRKVWSSSSIWVEPKTDWAVKVMLSWVRTAPLGIPVVPEV